MSALQAEKNIAFDNPLDDEAGSDDDTTFEQEDSTPRTGKSSSSERGKDLAVDPTAACDDGRSEEEDEDDTAIGLVELMTTALTMEVSRRASA